MKTVVRCFWAFGLLLVLGLPLWSAPAPTAPPRFALVIGNADYGSLGQLKNPANDATDMGKALQALGFQTEVLTNADLPSMENAVVRLSSLLSTDKSATGLFYFAGHGVQSNGVNYLLPAKADIVAEAFLKSKALSAQSVLDLLQSADNGLNLIFLDACRDNPFSWSRSLSRGLSVVGSQPTGSILAYATSAGSTAQDGVGRNGVFTGELLKHLATPGLDIKQVLDLTGAGVMKATSNKQVPAIYSQFFGSYYLASAPEGGVPASSGPPARTPAPDNDPLLTLDGNWYFQGTGAGQGKGKGEHQDSRLVISAAKETLVFYHYESPSTLKSWRKDVPGDTQSIDAIDNTNIFTTITEVVPTPWGGAEVGAKATLLYRIVGDELQIWWDWGQGLPDPYHWKDYVSYQRTRP